MSSTSVLDRGLLLLLSVEFSAPTSFLQHSWSSEGLGVASLTLSSRPCPYLDLMCCAEPRQRNLPSTWMAMREQSASASSMECVVRMTTLFLRFSAMFWTTDHMPRRATGSMPADGSSKKTMGGSPMVAIATEVLRL